MTPDNDNSNAPLDWRNRPYPDPQPTPGPDVSAAACAARGEVVDRRVRRELAVVKAIVGVLVLAVAAWALLIFEGLWVAVALALAWRVWRLLLAPGAAVVVVTAAIIGFVALAAIISAAVFVPEMIVLIYLLFRLVRAVEQIAERVAPKQPQP